MSVDTETTGLEHHDRLFAIILGTANDEYYFDRRTLGDGFLHDENFRILFSPPRVLLFQNAKFDMSMLVREGVAPIAPVADIAVLARLCRNDHITYSLDAQAKRLGWAKDDAVKAYIKEHKLYETRRNYLGEEYTVPRYDWVPVDVMFKYACTDARLTYDIYMHYMETLPTESIPLWRDEMMLTHTLFDMEQKGVRVDIPKILRAKEYEAGLLLEAKSRFHSMTGYHYDENNRKTLIKVFTEAGETFEYTEKGNPKVDKDALKKFRSPAANVVREIRKYEKRISTYYDSFLNHADTHGNIHARIWQGGTTTGRFSYSDPNLQNIPKEDSEDDMARPYVIRECLIPRDGHYFLSIDYSQQEYRLMLDYANERRMIEQVLAGVDVHQATADLLGITRKYAKTVNFAVLYGAGPDKLALMLGISLLDARRLIDRYLMGMPRVDSFIAQVKATARQRGFIRNWAGRRLYCGRGFEYAMPNHLIQGGCSDVTRRAMLALGTAPMLVQIHDQLLFEVPIGTPKDKLQNWQHLMETAYTPRNGLILAADASFSTKSFAERDMEKGLCPNE